MKRRFWHRTKRIVKHLFTEEEWSTFRQTEELSEEKSERLFATIAHRLQEKPVQSKGKIHVYWPGLFAAAATFLLLLTVIGLWKAHITLEADQKKSDQQFVRSTSSQWRIYDNKTANDIRFVLSDSSLIILSANSSVKYLANFGDHSRELFLKGKAFFKIAKNIQKPFSVFAGGLKTTVLGTSFTINTSDKGRHTRVELHSGKIQIESIQSTGNFQKRILLPGQQISFDQVTQGEVSAVPLIPKQKREAAPNRFERKGSILSFNKMPLDGVVKVLEANYRVHIDLEDNLHAENTSYTGEIDMQLEPIDGVLEKLCLLNGLTLEQNQDDRFTIRKDKTKTP
ncbi:FecR domain-containing protein [Olivibacter sp. CPCC 100613]|uniref:FecR family protein n=1 Tax=Olivibacter sp. CPCC 100613 TaxID=3079931 RepID=UPI002FF4D9B9